MEKDNQESLEDKRDQILTDALLRIASLEKLLISKNLVTEKELTDFFLHSATKLLELIKIAQPKSDIKNGN